MGKWVTSFLLILLISLCCMAGCTHAPPPLFQPDQYPRNLYYLGEGTATNKNYGEAREEARLRAKKDLIVQLTHSTVATLQTVLTSDDGTTHQSIFEEKIIESVAQEVEGVRFIEEPFHQRESMQTTWAILSKQEWELQKLTKIERERSLARAILSERYPDMPVVREILVLDQAITLLERGIWGALVEDRFDDTFGNILNLSQARLYQLYPKVLQSSRVYRTYEGTSQRSFSDARQMAGELFVSYLVNRLISEYSALRIRYDSVRSEGQQQSDIKEYVFNFMNKHPALLEYIPGPDSYPGSWQVFAVVAQAYLEEALNRDIDDLSLQTNAMKHAFDKESTITGKLAQLAKIRSLLESSFIGLAIEDELFGHGSRSLKSLENNLVESVQLFITAPDSLQVGTQDQLVIRVQSPLALGSAIAASLVIRDPSHKVIQETTISLSSNRPFSQLIDIQGKAQTGKYLITCTWDDYPQRSASQTMVITPIPLWTRIKSWFSK